MLCDLTDAAQVREMAQKLRQLPAPYAPPVPWAQFKRRQLLRRARVRAARRQLVIAGLGLVMVGALALREQASRLPLPGAEPSAQRLASVERDEAAGRSRAAERWLALQPAEPAIVRVGTRAAVTHLEDRIAWVDDTLSRMRAESTETMPTRALQAERDRLINSLAQVRYAETLAAQLP